MKTDKTRSVLSGAISTSGAFVVGVLVACAPVHATSPAPAAAPATVTPHSSGESATKLGNFSVSLAVKDLAASRVFYEKLGFKMVSGDPAKNWIVLQNESTKIGLFQGMFPRNTMTFNPGWDSNKATLAEFVDVRELQKTLKSRGLTPEPAADESTSGPAYFMLADPDGNPILIDQHVASPKK
jgi:catechol 2,3-dioxygenase-like lactoylglutathione lyase family enzyme